MKKIFKHISKMNERSASLLLMLLLSSDIVFNGIHIFKHIYVPITSSYEIRVNAYLEIFHLVKLFWINVLFVYILISKRIAGYLSWIFVFTFFLFDDALLIHQNIADLIVNSMDAHLPHNLSFPRFFELAVLAIAGIILSAIVAWAYFRSTQTFRKISKDLIFFMAALVFFGLIADLGSAIKLGPATMLALDIIEDGGEMLVFSLTLWYVFLLAICNGKPDRFILDLLNKHNETP